jgi:rhodanese-related sulfurtransferase
VGLFTRTPSTNPADLAERLTQGSVFVLDVRQPSEWRHGHIHGSRNVPLMHLKSHLATLPPDKTIVTVCASGHRSAAAARTLQRRGHQVENLKGGMRAWSRADLPVERTAKRPR